MKIDLKTLIILGLIAVIVYYRHVGVDLSTAPGVNASGSDLASGVLFSEL